MLSKVPAACARCALASRKGRYHLAGTRSRPRLAISQRHIVNSGAPAYERRSVVQVNSTSGQSLCTSFRAVDDVCRMDSAFSPIGNIPHVCSAPHLTRMTIGTNGRPPSVATLCASSPQAAHVAWLGGARGGGAGVLGRAPRACPAREGGRGTLRARGAFFCGSIERDSGAT